MATYSASRCDRARAWVSLRVDGELSQLESALLDAHLRRCAGCSSFATEVEASTLAVQAAPLVLLEGPIVIPVRRRSARTGGLVAAAAVVAASLAAALVGIHQLNGSGRTPRQTAMISSTSETGNSFRELRREQLIAQSRPIPRNKAVF
jgi:predicted anti-sigma-YlaC factor YlaD